MKIWDINDVLRTLLSEFQKNKNIPFYALVKSIVGTSSLSMYIKFIKNEHDLGISSIAKLLDVLGYDLILGIVPKQSKEIQKIDEITEKSLQSMWNKLEEIFGTPQAKGDVTAAITQLSEKILNQIIGEKNGGSELE